MKKQLRNEFLKYVTLNIMGMVALSCYILSDTYFVANGIGMKGLASLNLAISIYNILHGSGLMIGIGGATRYTICKASGEDKKADQVFSATILLGLVIGISFLIIGVFFNEGIAHRLGSNDTTLRMTSVYIRTILCFSPFFIFNNVLIAFIRNDGAPKVAMSGMLFGSLSNVVLDYIFIYPFGMGMFGAAFATCLAPIISILVMSPYLFTRKNGFHLVSVGRFYLVWGKAKNCTNIYTCHT
ncbi:MAG TPA: MATE family efflux transporter, partial [Lachnospiraceae bacterium]|nr:MATE family efflux transporter [Lachnospiraceae bacterium]